MNTYESLTDEAFNDGINVVDYHFDSPNIKGLYCDGVVGINKEIETSVEKSCVLAEELGHHHTSIGDIIDQSNSENRKQEHKARVWGYDRMIGLLGIIKAFDYGCQSRCEIAEYLDTTEKYLEEAIGYYRSKYGVYTTIDRYIIYFIPNLSVAKFF